MKGGKKSSATSVGNYNFLREIPRLALALLLIMLLACSHARPPRQGMSPPRGGTFLPREAPEDLIVTMWLRLDLSEDQQERVRPILDRQYKKQREIIEKYKGEGGSGRDALKNELKALQNSTEEQLAAILTQEQMEGYKQIVEEQHRPPGGGHLGMYGGRGGGMGGDMGGRDGGGNWPSGPEICPN